MLVPFRSVSWVMLPRDCAFADIYEAAHIRYMIFYIYIYIIYYTSERTLK